MCTRAIARAGIPGCRRILRRPANASQAERLARAVGRVLADRGVTGGARVRLTMANCADGPTLVQINLQVGDTPLRAQAATAGIDDLRPALIRLDRQIVRASAQWCPGLGRIGPAGD